MSTNPRVERGGTVDLGQLKRNRLKREEARSVVEELTSPVVVPAVVDLPEPVPVSLVVADPTVAPVAAEVPVAAPIAPVVVAAAPAAAVTPDEPVKEKPVKTGFFQAKEDGDRMRRTYSDTRPMTQHATLSEFICFAVDQYCTQLEEEFNEGKQYTSDPGQVRRGRPLKAP